MLEIYLWGVLVTFVLTTILAHIFRDTMPLQLRDQQWAVTMAVCFVSVIWPVIVVAKLLGFPSKRGV